MNHVVREPGISSQCVDVWQEALVDDLICGNAIEITEDDVDLFTNPGSAPKDSISYLVSQNETIASFRDAAEEAFLRRKLTEFDGNISKMSDSIDLQRSNIYAKLKKFGIKE